MKEFFDQFKEFWSKLGPNQKASIILVTGLSVVVLSSVVMYAGGPNYAALPEAMTSENAGSIYDFLSKNGFEYKTEGADTILVEADKRHRIIAKMTEDGVFNANATGFSILDQNDIGLTGELVGVKIHRAWQGEVEKVINAMSFVQSSRVLVSRPEKRIFGRDKEKAKGTVHLTLKPGRIPPPQAIKGIQLLVSGPWPGLASDQVSVMDQHGNVLARPKDGKGMDAVAALAASEKLGFQQLVEDKMTSTAQEALDLAYGPNMTIVKVSASIQDPPTYIEEKTYTESAPKKTTTIKKIKPILTPDKGTAVSTDPNATNPAGTPATPPAGGATTSSEESPKETTDETTTENFPPSMKMVVPYRGGFTIAKLSVSLWIDKSLTQEPQPDWQPDPNAPEITEAPMVDKQDVTGEITKIEDQVKATIGWDANRDQDFKSLVTKIYKENFVLEDPPGLFDVASIMEMLKYGTQALVVLFLLIFLKNLMKKAGGKKKGPSLPGVPEGEELPPEVIERIQARRSAEALITADSEGAARVAKQWAGAEK